MRLVLIVMLLIINIWSFATEAAPSYWYGTDYAEYAGGYDYALSKSRLLTFNIALYQEWLEANRPNPWLLRLRIA